MVSDRLLPGQIKGHDSGVPNSTDTLIRFCAHCNSPINNQPTTDAKDGLKLAFCCHGCETVHQFITEQGLGKFYQIKQEMGGDINQQKIDTHLDQYAYLDDPHFLSDHGKLEEDGSVALSFYVEGITCYACVWLIEKLPELHKEIRLFKYNPGTNSLKISIPKEYKFAPILLTLEKLGHKTRLLEDQDQIEQWQKEEERNLLKKMAVAGFSFGNVMLLAVAQYAGSERQYHQFFGYLALLLSFPTVAYSATPFYKSTWLALKNKSINLDVPLALAIILGFAGSTYNIFTQSDHYYLDSITGLIFLILITRYILRVSARHTFKVGGLQTFFESGSVKIWDVGLAAFKSIHKKYLKSGDLLQIEEGQIVPADGPIQSGPKDNPVHLNLAFLTGESEPVALKKDALALAGAINVGSKFLMQAEKIGSHSRLGKILLDLETEEGSKAPIVLKADRISKYVLTTILLLAGFIVAQGAFNGNLEQSFMRALALMIVTCPCALALATPMALTMGLKYLTQKGILVKKESTIENLAKIDEVFLDKTGTITEGELCVISTEILTHNPDSSFSWQELCLAMEKISHHPIAKAIRRFLEAQHIRINPSLKIDNLKEEIGFGVQCQVKNNAYMIRSYQEETTLDSNETTIKSVALYRNDAPVFLFKIKDQLRHDAKTTITLLKKMGIKVRLVSGDHQPIVQQIGAQAGLVDKKGEIFFEKSPDQKKAIIQFSIEQGRHVLMVGDGANDALALKAATVGVAVNGSMEAGLNASHIFLTKPGVSQIATIIWVGKKINHVITRNLIISLVYNLIGAGLAIMGIINPLAAAILMPVSSITVLASTLIQDYSKNPFDLSGDKETT